MEQLKDFVVRLEARFGKERVVAQLRTDSASYFAKSLVLKKFCDQKGIELTHSPPYTQALNSVAERHLRTLLDVNRALLVEAGAHVSFWGFAIKYAVKICNRFYNKSSCRPAAVDAPPSDNDNNDDPVHIHSPLELFSTRTLPNQRKKLKVFGCTVYPLTHDENPDKFNTRAEPHCFLGLDDATGGYICGVLPHCIKALVRAYCVFDESGRPLKATHSNHQGDYRLLPGPDVDTSDSFPLGPRRSQRSWTPSGPCLEAIADEKTSAPVHTATSAEIASFVEDVYATNHGPITYPSGSDPKNHREAMSLPNADEWRISEIEEVNSHRHNKTFGPAVKLPPGFKAIPADWVYKTKRCSRKKSRIVLKGFHMKSGIDFNETFAPVAVIKSIRFLLALCAKHDLELLSFDIKTAFLSADMDAEVYVYLPSMTTQASKRRPRGALLFTAYSKGSQASPRGAVYTTTSSTSLGFTRAPDDYCLYTHAT